MQETRPDLCARATLPGRRRGRGGNIPDPSSQTLCRQREALCCRGGGGARSCGSRGTLCSSGACTCQQSTSPRASLFLSPSSSLPLPHTSKPLLLFLSSSSPTHVHAFSSPLLLLSSSHTHTHTYMLRDNGALLEDHGRHSLHGCCLFACRLCGRIHPLPHPTARAGPPVAPRPAPR